MTQASSEFIHPVEQESLTGAFMRYRKGLQKLVSKIVQANDVEDVVHETYVRSYQNSLKQPIEHPRTYLYTAARNIAITHANKKYVEVEELVNDFDSHEHHQVSSVEKIMVSQEKMSLFCDAVEQLPEKCREVFVMKRVYGMSQKEIAAELDISERTVERHIAKGAFRCAMYLEEQGYDVLSGQKA